MTDSPTIHLLPDAEDRYRAMSVAFDRACAQAAEPDPPFEFCLSGIPARLRVAGSTLRERVVRPFRHLAQPWTAGASGLTIDLWDETQTGVGCEGCAVDESLDTWGGWKCSADGRFLVHHRRTALEIYDRQEQRILGWSTGPIHVSHHERGRPLLRLLMQWHRDHGRHVIHGGLVESDGVGVLLVGKSGSGKSTTALLCALDGLTFLSEDFLAIGRDAAGAHHGHSIFASAKLHPGHLERFPRLRAVALGPEHPEDDKSLLFLEHLEGARVGRSVRIGAVVAPRIGGTAGSSFRRISRGAALMDLAPSTLVLLNGYGLGLRRGEVVARHLDEFAGLLAACPSYRLELGHDLGSVAPAVRAIIADARGAAATAPVLSVQPA